MSASIEGHRLALAGSMRSAMRWLIALTTLPFLIAVVVLTTVYLHGGQGARHAPLALLIAIPASVLLAQFLLVRGITRASVSIDRGDLVVHTGLGTKRVQLSRLRQHGVQVVDLDERRELKPMLRLWGTGLPGFAAGWFRLRNGEKAVCLLTQRQRVTRLRSDEDNLTLLLSLADPGQLRDRLQR